MLGDAGEPRVMLAKLADDALRSTLPEGKVDIVLRRAEADKPFARSSCRTERFTFPSSTKGRTA